jgi:transcriptional regulator with XRE-family HTH domain
VSNKAIQLQKSFGEFLRAERKKRGLSQAHLAQLADISTTYESQLERGEKMASLDIILRLAKALDLTGAKFLEKGGF